MRFFIKVVLQKNTSIYILKFCKFKTSKFYKTNEPSMLKSLSPNEMINSELHVTVKTININT